MGFPNSLFLKDEDPAEFFSLLESSFEYHQPTNPQDSGLVTDAVLARWFVLRRQRMCIYYEAALHELNLFDRYKTQAERAEQATENQEEPEIPTPARGLIPPEYDWLITEPWQRKANNVELSKRLSFEEWRNLTASKQKRQPKKAKRGHRGLASTKLQTQHHMYQRCPLFAFPGADVLIRLPHPVRFVKYTFSSPRIVACRYFPFARIAKCAFSSPSSTQKRSDVCGMRTRIKPRRAA